MRSFERFDRPKIGSIVRYRNRKWKYVYNENCMAHLVLCEGEKPCDYGNGFVTEINTDIKNLIIVI